MQMFSVPLVRVRRSQPSPEYLFIKRAFDIFVSLIGIIVTSPIMLVTAIAIMAYDHGPALYKQVRLCLLYTSEMVKNSPEEVKKAVEGKTALTPVMDVKADGAQKDANGKYVVTFNVQNLTSSVKNVTVLHFNGTAWEVVESSFDAAAKTVTAKFASLSPVVVVADTGSKMCIRDSLKPGSGRL